jgi:outer membrane protein OmpA-like peptidoglycan-associated protein
VVQEKLNFAARNIFFESGKDILKKESIDDLDNVVGIMKKYDFLKLDVNGHTDASGNEASNLKLSQNRAAAVVKYLMDHGVTPTRLTSAGYGSSRPVADNKTAAGKAKNRRVEIVIKD